MHTELLNLLKRSVGSKLTSDLAADIYVAAGRNDHDDLVKECDVLKKRVMEMHDGGMKIIQDHSERTKEAIKFREQRDELVEALREMREAWNVVKLFSEMRNMFSRVDAILAKYTQP